MTAGGPEGAGHRQGARDALRLISYGLYVVTTTHPSGGHAITFNWLTQASFEPLLVVAAVEHQSRTHQLLRDSGAFAVNFLSKTQVHLARRMAVPSRMNPHKLVGVPYHSHVTGAPLLDEAIGYLECRVTQSVEVGGDHTLYVGEVVAGAVTGQAEPLTLADSRLRYK